MSVKSPLGLVLYCYLNMPTINKTYPILSYPILWLITGFVTRLTERVSLVEQELLTIPEHLSSPRVLVGSCFSIISFICMSCRSLFVLLCFLFWPLCCLFFFDLRILITTLVSSNSSYTRPLTFLTLHRHFNKKWLAFK